MATKGVSKDVKYLNKDFSAFRDGLIEFAKTYFPNTYNDFNESSNDSLNDSLKPSTISNR